MMDWSGEQEWTSEEGNEVIWLGCMAETALTLGDQFPPESDGNAGPLHRPARMPRRAHPRHAGGGDALSHAALPPRPAQLLPAPARVRLPCVVERQVVAMLRAASSPAFLDLPERSHPPPRVRVCWPRTTRTRTHLCGLSRSPCRGLRRRPSPTRSWSTTYFLRPTLRT